MKIPLINTDPQVQRAIVTTVAQVNQSEAAADPQEAVKTVFEVMPVETQQRAIEYINYQMPALMLLNFSDPVVDAFDVMRHITADPWLNHGGIVALYEGSGTFNRINELKDSNIIIHLSHHDIERQLGTVLGVLRSNQQILFQRALQTDLLGSMSGQFELSQDVMLVPAYANLVSNYVFNVGFVDAEAKAKVSLVLTEMLMNAIEHGNCGISFEEKRAHLDAGGSIQQLIATRCEDPAIRARRVRYNYEIHRAYSIHTIRDEGTGFDWKLHLKKGPELDYLAEHGRGILLARETADRIEYNAAGNQVTLEIRHRSGGANIPGVFRDADLVECAPGDVIFSQGEASDFLYYVAEGDYRVLVNGRHVANLSPADVLMGEMSLLLDENRSATVIANTRGRLIRISKLDFIDIVKNQPYYGLLLSRLMAQRLLRLNRGVLS